MVPGLAQSGARWRTLHRDLLLLSPFRADAAKHIDGSGRRREARRNHNDDVLEQGYCCAVLMPQVPTVGNELVRTGSA